MPADLAALRNHIENTPALLAKLESGANWEIVLDINGTSDTGIVPVAVPRSKVLEAIGSGIRSLSADALQRLRILLSDDPVDFSKQAIRDEVRQIFSGQSAVLDRLTDAATRPKRLADRFGVPSISLEDVRAVAEAVPSSHYNKYLRGEV